VSGRTDARFWLLLAAAVLGCLGIADPQIDYRRQRYDALFVVDITGSMNVRDYRLDGAPQSRLDHVKATLAALIADLPCGSRAGVGVFAERRPFLLVAPVETCANFAPLAGMLQQLDWRMAWEGDSYVASGLYQSIELAAAFDTDLVFLTDGQEAPPLHWSGAVPFGGEPGTVHGLIVGVGDVIPSPIPKFDRDGRENGFLEPGDVVQENRSGTPPPDAERREGWHPRNAPWGAAAASGEEHLSAVQETHLRALAAATGLGYVRLTPGLRLDRALATQAAPREADARLSLAPWYAAAALILLTAVWRPERAGRPPSLLSLRPRRPV